MAATFYVKLDYHTPPRPIALFRVDGHFGEYFDKSLKTWVADGSIPMRMTEDIDVAEVDADIAADIEARFRAV